MMMRKALQELRYKCGRHNTDSAIPDNGVRLSKRWPTLSTSGGSITLLLPPNTPGSVDAETSGGSVTSDFPLTTTHFSSGSHVQGTIGGGGAPISLHTSGGSIHLGPES